MKNQDYVVCALYHFVRLADHAALKQPLLKLMQHQGIKGTLLLAAEGINAPLQENAMDRPPIRVAKKSRSV